MQLRGGGGGGSQKPRFSEKLQRGQVGSGAPKNSLFV